MMTLLFSLAVVMLLLSGGRQVMAGTLTVGSFVQFMQYLFMLQWPMLALGWTINLLQKGRTSWGRIRSILGVTPAIRDTETTDGSVTTLGGDIDFEGVRLVLGGRTVLDGIDLRILPGEIVGVTGPTGAGKTVLVWLIARLLEATEGVVKVGGHDVRRIPLDVLRRTVGLAPQEAFLFSDTLANNIAFGMTEEDLEKIYTAAEVAQLSPDVELFPDRYETLLGERGVTLSGGQRQRTAISRAIARNPAVLILDDVFSAIDTQTEANIQARLRPVLRDRTSIIISHRVSSLRHVDRIIVLSGGRVVQQGTHAELIALPGYYRDLDEVQRLEARLETAP
jgi:ATP-binding cassette subfamily B protein